MSVRRLVAGILLVAASSVVPPGVAAAAPAAAPGDVVTSRAVNAPGFFYANTWLVTYRSTSATGRRSPSVAP